MTTTGGGVGARITADLIARAIIAASTSYGDDPAKALAAKAGRARRSLLAVASAMVGPERTMRDAAKLLKVGYSALWSARRRRGEGFNRAEAAARRALDYAAWRPECAASAIAALPAESAPSVAALSPRPQAADRSKLPPVRPKRGQTGPKARRRERRAAVRLKPVNPRVVRWAGQFLRARWDLDDVAWLFDVDPEALGQAVRPA